MRNYRPILCAVLSTFLGILWWATFAHSGLSKHLHSWLLRQVTQEWWANGPEQRLAQEICKPEKGPPSIYDCQAVPVGGGLPQFILISPDKTGSTAIFEDLSAGHSQISNGVACKELHFWDRKYDENISHQKNMMELRKYFPPPCADLVMGESTPGYFVQAQVARRIAMHLPAVKLICVLRNPVERFLSRLVGNLFHQATDKRHACDWHLDHFWKRERLLCQGLGADVGRQGICVKHEEMHGGPIGTGLYWTNLKVWGRYFKLTGKSRDLLVLPSEWFGGVLGEHMASKSLQKIAEFLGLRPWSEKELANRPTMRRHVGSSHKSALNISLTDPQSELTKDLAKRAGTDHWQCEDGTIASLERIYRWDNAKLGEYLRAALLSDGLDLSEWPFPPWLTYLET
mmetsp:Transcript_8174/g.18237  ORF Transcript_8174/g.18237 Transcript_8174/m.18237 type:complete len:400 (+) Transcript_8174:42-1241(+)